MLVAFLSASSLGSFIRWFLTLLVLVSQILLFTFKPRQLIRFSQVWVMVIALLLLVLAALFLCSLVEPLSYPQLICKFFHITGHIQEVAYFLSMKQQISLLCS